MSEPLSDVLQIRPAPYGWSIGLSVEQERIALSNLDDWQFDSGKDRWGWYFSITTDKDTYHGEGISKRAAFDQAFTQLKNDGNTVKVNNQAKDFNGANKLYPKAAIKTGLIDKLS